MKYQIFAWDDEPTEQETPLLIVAEKLNSGRVKLVEGMEIIGLETRNIYRLDKFDFKSDHDERNKQHRLYLTEIVDGKDGKQKVGSSINYRLAVKLASIVPEHQELFYTHQKVNGSIQEGVLVPDPEYLVNWHAMFMKYFDILRSHPFRGQSGVERAMPELVRKCVEELGVGAFNDFIRYYYVGKTDMDKALQDGSSALYDGYFCEVSRKQSFPERVLFDTTCMTEDFANAVRTVVFKEGVKLDIAKLIA